MRLSLAQIRTGEKTFPQVAAGSVSTARRGSCQTSVIGPSAAFLIKKIDTALARSRKRPHSRLKPVPALLFLPFPTLPSVIFRCEPPQAVVAPGRIPVSISTKAPGFALHRINFLIKYGDHHPTTRRSRVCPLPPQPAISPIVGAIQVLVTAGSTSPLHRPGPCAQYHHRPRANRATDPGCQ